MSYRIKSECIVCGICEMICPEKAIIEDEEENIFRIIPTRCNSCGKCAEVCPVDAVTS
ncbi:4Fe-4S binding protein [bacterium]|nr:4Fe-4S binding protein [candidate division CSSED10-310 bacterium]